MWCEFDPIGVVNSLAGPDDDYNAYLGPSLRLLERAATVDEIASYDRTCLVSLKFRELLRC